MPNEHLTDIRGHRPSSTSGSLIGQSALEEYRAVNEACWSC